jgi:hypothetical protein
MVTSGLKTINFHAANEKTQYTLRPNVFSSSSQKCPHQVPKDSQVPNVLPKLFPIAPQFYPISFWFEKKLIQPFCDVWKCNLQHITKQSNVYKCTPTTLLIMFVLILIMFNTQVFDLHYKCLCSCCLVSSGVLGHVHVFHFHSDS